MSSAPVGTSQDNQTWPKEADFTKEELRSIFWSKSSWNSRTNHSKGATSLNNQKGKRGKSRASEGINVKMLYVVDREGIPVDGHRAVAIRAVARSIWGQLSANGLAPQKWMADSNLQVIDHYRREMQNRCEELRLCEGGWKTDQIAIDYYSSWRKAKATNGRFNAPVKEEEEEEEEDYRLTTDDNEDLDHNADDNNTESRCIPQVMDVDREDLVLVKSSIKRQSNGLDVPLPKKRKIDTSSRDRDITMVSDVPKGKPGAVTKPKPKQLNIKVLLWISYLYHTMLTEVTDP
jgi:hypothetical protein